MSCFSGVTVETKDHTVKMGTLCLPDPRGLIFPSVYSDLGFVPFGDQGTFGAWNRSQGPSSEAHYPA